MKYLTFMREYGNILLWLKEINQTIIDFITNCKIEDLPK